MALTERFQETTQIGYWTGQIPLEYIYTMGRAGQAFFETIRDKGKLMGARCGRCDITYVPPRIYCEQCFDRLEGDFQEVSSKGQVHTFTVLHRNLDGTAKDKPLVLALIRLEGTDGGLIHYLDKVDPEELAIGLTVQAVFKPKKDRKGGLSDIRYFKPA